MTTPSNQYRPQPSADPLVPHDFSDWFSKIIDAVGRSWRPVGLLQLMVGVPVAIGSGAAAAIAGDSLNDLSQQLGQNGDIHVSNVGSFMVAVVVLGLIALLVGTVVQLASLRVIITDANQERPSLAAGLRFGLRRALPLIGWEIIAGLLVSIGFLVLLLPGIYLAVVLLPTLTGVVGVDRKGIGRCFEIARGRFWSLLGRCAMALLFVVAYSQLETLIIKLIFGDDPSPWGSELVSGLLNLPLQVVAVAFFVVTYVEARAGHEPTSTAGLRGAV